MKLQFLGKNKPTPGSKMISGSAGIWSIHPKLKKSALKQQFLVKLSAKKSNPPTTSKLCRKKQFFGFNIFLDLDQFKVQKNLDLNLSWAALVCMSVCMCGYVDVWECGVVGGEEDEEEQRIAEGQPNKTYLFSKTEGQLQRLNQNPSE